MQKLSSYLSDLICDFLWYRRIWMITHTEMMQEEEWKHPLFISRSGKSSDLDLGTLIWIQTSPAAESRQWDYGIPHNERTDLNIPFYSSSSWRGLQPYRWWIKSTVRSQMGLSQLLAQTIEYVCIPIFITVPGLVLMTQRQMGPLWVYFLKRFFHLAGFSLFQESCHTWSRANCWF